MVGPEDQRRLLSLARQALEARVRGDRGPDADRAGMLDDRRGAFVTIHCDGELRGCLGRIDTSWPLGRTIAHLAEAVADSDPRFDPVGADELDRIEIEISVLTAEVEIASIDAVDVGRHGMIVEHHGRRGLLLPQVAPEHGWDVRQLVEHTCVKAGLPPDAWRHGARLFVFEAQVFAEPRAGRQDTSCI